VTETWLTGTAVVDVDTGTVTPDRSVRITDGRISAITDAVPDGVPARDLGGRYLLPGLVTVHTHLSIVFPFSDTDEDEDPALTAFRSADRATAALRAGATTIRCVHEQHRADITLRDAARRGWFTAPRILAGGRALSVPGGHGQGTGSVYCTGPEEFYAAAMGELAAGADHLKIFISGGLAHDGESPAEPEMTDAEIAAVVRAADSAGAYVVAHSGHFTAIRQALDAGVRSFEHAYLVDEATAALLAAPDVYVSPTLAVSRSVGWMRRNGFEEHSIANAIAVGPEHLASAQRLIAAGVRLTNGTDYPPGDDADGVPAVVAELEFMAGAGLSPLDALRTATVNGAALCGISDEVGRVAVGQVADLIAVTADPTVDVAALRDITFVVSEGRIIRDGAWAA
jgi:imidazolonepropionase-like amidohydrolase